MHFRTMVKHAIHTLIPFLVLVNIAGCTTNPYTNRSQFLLIPESQEAHMGNQAYAQALNDPKVVISKNPAEVGARDARGRTDYCRGQTIQIRQTRGRRFNGKSR